MEAAKDSVKKFVSKAGQHDTTVHEKVAPAVTHETVSRTQQENVTPVVDKEVHQDHHHTSVQPVHDSQTLPEQHHSKAVPVEHRSFEHDKEGNVKRSLADEQAQFVDKQHHVDGERTTSEAPLVTGEHKHHHVHETIQPVVQKQTIEPHVTHTTVPVHEVHHNTTQHHAASALPAVNMADFKKQGGSLTGREERSDAFQGEPRRFDGVLGSDKHSTGRDEHSDEFQGQPRTVGGAVAGDNLNGSQKGTNELNRDTTDDRKPVSKPAGKPSLLDKLNPKKDADGDGKAGFMK